MLCLPYYCLCLLFNKIRDKGRTDSAWKWGREWAGEEGGGGQGGEMTQTMYAYVNKWVKKKKGFISRQIIIPFEYWEIRWKKYTLILYILCNMFKPQYCQRSNKDLGWRCGSSNRVPASQEWSPECYAVCMLVYYIACMYIVWSYVCSRLV
jgi:hypothetical protein